MARFPVRPLQVHHLRLGSLQAGRSQAVALTGLMTLLLAPLLPAPALRAEPLGASAGHPDSIRPPYSGAVPLAPEAPTSKRQVATLQSWETAGMASRKGRNPGSEFPGAQPLLAQAASPAPQANSEPGLGEALAPSSPAQLALGAYLRQKGFLFYGAWWCPACFRQKSLFGEQAGQRLPYVECDRSDAGRERCTAADIRAYPTWVRGQERREGVLSLEELARWSGWKPR